jgi:hypothetical protein
MVLKKARKPVYDVCVKVIGDIATAALKAAYFGL